MNEVALIEIGHYLNNVKIPDIPEETNFWLIRTMSGYYYDEFVREGYVALGWNIITKSTAFDRRNIENLKDQIKVMYNDKRPGVAINKCIRFIHELKEGDYVLIPNAGSTKVTVGILEDYYEVKHDHTEEWSATEKIENKESEIGRIKCPYRKRRHMKVVMTITAQRLGYKILKGLSSYHGLSNMNEYNIDILNCIYNCYTYKGDMMYSLNIAKNEPIKARELSKLMYGVTELFCNIIDEDLISITINLNSPGKVTVKLRSVYEKLKKGAFPLLGIYLFVFGGSGWGFEFPGLAGGVIDVIQEYRTMDTEVKLKEEELKGKQLENYKAAMEVIQLSKETGIDMDKVVEDLKIIDGLDDSLKFESNEEFAKGGESQESEE